MNVDDLLKKIGIMTLEGDLLRNEIERLRLLLAEAERKVDTKPSKPAAEK